jgi:hypothetical protein
VVFDCIAVRSGLEATIVTFLFSVMKGKRSLAANAERVGVYGGRCEGFTMIDAPKSCDAYERWAAHFTLDEVERGSRELPRN